MDWWLWAIPGVVMDGAIVWVLVDEYQWVRTRLRAADTGTQATCLLLLAFVLTTAPLCWPIWLLTRCYARVDRP